MKLITKEQRKQMLDNGCLRMTDPRFDPVPVVKLYALFSDATWLLSSISPLNPDMAFGLCDLGMGEPEIGWVALSELAKLKILGCCPQVEREKFFKGKAPLSVYAEKAYKSGRIV